VLIQSHATYLWKRAKLYQKPKEKRYALLQSHEPLLLAALVGPIALLSFAAFYASPACKDKLVWDRRAFWPLALSGIFETFAVLFMLVAFASGPVYIVSPISATVPIWTL
jgi:hypothetical protein